MVEYQGPVKPGTDEEKFRETGETTNLYQGPTLPTTDEETFRKTGETEKSRKYRSKYKGGTVISNNSTITKATEEQEKEFFKREKAREKAKKEKEKAEQLLKEKQTARKIEKGIRISGSEIRALETIGAVKNNRFIITNRRNINVRDGGAGAGSVYDEKFINLGSAGKVSLYSGFEENVKVVSGKRGYAVSKDLLYDKDSSTEYYIIQKQVEDVILLPKKKQGPQLPQVHLKPGGARETNITTTPKKVQKEPLQLFEYKPSKAIQGPMRRPEISFTLTGDEIKNINIIESRLSTGQEKVNLYNIDEYLKSTYSARRKVLTTELLERGTTAEFIRKNPNIVPVPIEQGDLFKRTKSIEKRLAEFTTKERAKNVGYFVATTVATAGLGAGLGLAAKSSNVFVQRGLSVLGSKAVLLSSRGLFAGSFAYEGFNIAKSSKDAPVAARLRAGRLIATTGGFILGSKLSPGLTKKIENNYPGLKNTLKKIENNLLEYNKKIGKRAAVFKGGRRISPRSKTQIKKQNLGIKSYSGKRKIDILENPLRPDRPFKIPRGRNIKKIVEEIIKSPNKIIIKAKNYNMKKGISTSSKQNRQIEKLGERAEKYEIRYRGTRIKAVYDPSSGRSISIKTKIKPRGFEPIKEIIKDPKKIFIGSKWLRPRIKPIKFEHIKEIIKDPKKIFIGSQWIARPRLLLLQQESAKLLKIQKINNKILRRNLKLKTNKIYDFSKFRGPEQINKLELKTKPLKIKQAKKILTDSSYAGTGQYERTEYFTSNSQGRDKVLSNIKARLLLKANKLKSSKLQIFDINKDTSKFFNNLPRQKLVRNFKLSIYTKKYFNDINKFNVKYLLRVRQTQILSQFKKLKPFVITDTSQYNKSKLSLIQKQSLSQKQSQDQLLNLKQILAQDQSLAQELKIKPVKIKQIENLPDYKIDNFIDNFIDNIKNKIYDPRIPPPPKPPKPPKPPTPPPPVPFFNFKFPEKYKKKQTFKKNKKPFKKIKKYNEYAATVEAFIKNIKQQNKLPKRFSGLEFRGL